MYHMIHKEPARASTMPDELLAGNTIVRVMAETLVYPVPATLHASRRSTPELQHGFRYKHI